MEDLAQDGLTHAQLADKYGRHIQTIHQFSARNHYEIECRKRELHGLLSEATADEWIKEKADLYALYRKHYEDLDARLSDPDIDDRTRDRLSKTAASILDKVRDLKGWLTTRTQVEQVGTPTYRYEIVSRRGVEPSLAERTPPTRASAPKPAPKPAPEPEPVPVSEPPAELPSSPASPGLMEDVPEEERRSFVRWMNG